MRQRDIRARTTAKLDSLTERTNRRCHEEAHGRTEHAGHEHSDEKGKELTRSPLQSRHKVGDEREENRWNDTHR